MARSRSLRLDDLDQSSRRAMKRWGRVWGESGLLGLITIRFSTRLRSSLGRARPSTGEVVLHSGLRRGTSGELLEVLCHEVAHVVAVRQARASKLPIPRPHGREWAALVRAAGFEPRAHMPGRRPTGNHSTKSLTVVHTCPVCQSQRVARRRVPAWRCAECVEAGLGGELVVSRRLGTHPTGGTTSNQNRSA